MAVHPNPRKGDIGTPIEHTIVSVANDGTTSVIDVSSATLKQMTFQDPDGVETTHTAAFTNSGTDGKIEYVTTATSDLGKTGLWLSQVYVEMPTGKWHGSVLKFKVDPNLADL